MHVPHCYHSATLHTGACTHEKVNAEVLTPHGSHGFKPVPMAAVSVSLESRVMIIATLMLGVFLYPA